MYELCLVMQHSKALNITINKSVFISNELILFFLPVFLRCFEWPKGSKCQSNNCHIFLLHYYYYNYGFCINSLDKAQTYTWATLRPRADGLPPAGIPLDSFNASD